jgi:hypothetical protein
MRNKFWNPARSASAGKVSGKQHWLQESSYPKWWIERAELLHSMLRNSPHSSAVSSFSEYGCGPHKPFRACLAKENVQTTCHTLDLKAWDSGVIIADLDEYDLSNLPDSGCGVLCGVLEYVQNPALTLKALASKHSFLLFSYCYADLSSAKSAKDKVDILAARAAMGWRNHLSIEELVSVSRSFGHIAEIAHWRDQALALAVRFDRA